MKTTIDRSGRVIVPKALREPAGIEADEIRIELDGSGLRIEPLSADTLVERDGRLVVPATDRTFTTEGCPGITPWWPALSSPRS